MQTSRMLFISYGREPEVSTPIAQELHNRIHDLDTPKLDAFLDTTDLDDSEKWRPQLARRIEDCFMMVILCSEKANNSQYVTYEWAYAMGLNKFILPIKLPNTKTEDISAMILDYNSSVLNFENPTEEMWNKLIRSIVDTYHRLYTPTPILRALDFAEHPLEDYRQQALNSLYENEHPKSVDALVKLVNESYLPQVRWDAARKLAFKHVGKLKYPDSTPDNPELSKRIKHKEKQEVAIPILADHLWSLDLYNNDELKQFKTALSALNKIGTPSAYQAMVDFYIKLDIGGMDKLNKRQEIINHFMNMPLQKIIPHAVRIIKHTYPDYDQRPSNKVELLGRLADAGSIEILIDIEQYLKRTRPDLGEHYHPLVIDQEKPLYDPEHSWIIEHMKNYKFDHLESMYRRILVIYGDNNSKYWENIAKAILKDLAQRQDPVIKTFLNEQIPIFSMADRSRSHFVSEIRNVLATFD